MATSIGTAKAGRWEFLDSMRGVAALMVVVEHWLDENNPTAREWTRNHLGLGAAGVVTFFLVSGFIIPVSIEKYNSLRAFWVGRLFRLFPLYLVTLGFTILLGAFGLLELPDFFHAHPVKFILGNCTMAQELFHVPYALPVYWTLSYEGVFYILCSCLFAFGVLGRARLWAILGPLTYLFGTLVLGFGLHRPLSAEKMGLIVTALLGTLIYRYSLGTARARDIAIAVPILAVSLGTGFWFRLVRFPKGDMSQVQGFSSLCTSWIVGSLIFAIFFMLREKQFPKVLLWLGRISYSVYLVHPIVIEVMPHHISPWISLPLTFLVTIMVSHLTYEVIEAPFQRLQHKFFPKKRRAAEVPGAIDLEVGSIAQ
jgi:peptidoglycan/LPS O-acetylase OafA/YrhL